MAYNLKSLIPIIVQIIQLKGFVSVAESFDSGKISTKELVIKDFNLIKNGQKPITINISNWRKNKEIIQKESESILKYLEDYFYENEMTEDYWKTVKFIVQNETFRKEKQTILNHVEIKIPDEKKTRSKK